MGLSLARAGVAAYRSIGSRRRARRSKTIERAFLIAFVLRAAGVALMDRAAPSYPLAFTQDSAQNDERCVSNSLSRAGRTRRA